MIKILEVLTYLGSGGAEMVVYNYLSHMDKDGLDFEIAVINNPQKKFLESKFLEMGIRIHYLPQNPIKRIWAFRHLLNENHYDAIHSHCEFLSEIYLLMAKHRDIPLRIMHSHIASPILPLSKAIYQPIGHFIAKISSTHFFGCGIDACINLWGKKYFETGRCYIMNNAIEIDKFKFSAKTRDQYRKQLNWENKYVVLNVGRFTKQKNHNFIIDTFKLLSEQDKSVLLVLIGEGELFDDINAKVKECHLEDNVQFLGRRNDVAEILNAADVFFLPSLYEGLPVVSIEAQTNGLPIVMSSTITKECGITDISSFCCLDGSLNLWIANLLNKGYRDRSRYAETMAKCGYDIYIESQKLKKFYLDHLKK